MKKGTNLGLSTLLLIMITTWVSTTSCCANKPAYDSENGKYVEKKVNVGSFNAIDASTSIDVYIYNGTSNIATVKAKSDIVNNVLVYVKGNTLYARLKSGSYRNTGSISVTVSTTALNSIKTSGASDIYFKSPFKGQKLRISASGSSDIKDIDVEYNQIEVSLSGSSDMKKGKLKAGVCNIMLGGSSDYSGTLVCTQLILKASGSSDTQVTGSCRQADIMLSGASDFKGKDFSTVNAYIKSSGSSNAHIRVSDNLSAQASGASDIYCYGTPKQKNTSSSGASSIKFK